MVGKTQIDFLTMRNTQYKFNEKLTDPVKYITKMNETKKTNRGKMNTNLMSRTRIVPGTCCTTGLCNTVYFTREGTKNTLYISSIYTVTTNLIRLYIYDTATCFN